MEKKERPLVSVVIPAYNNEDTIGATVKSVMGQTYRNLEIIVVDDASTDGTAEVILGLQEKDARIRLYRNEKNLGMAGNWNECMRRAGGEYVKLVCADDLLDAEAIEREAEAMERYPSVNLVESDTRLVDIYGKKTGVFRRYRKAGVVDGKKIAKTALVWNNFFGAPVNNLIRRSVFRETGYFDSGFTYILDFDLWIRIACAGDVYIIHELLNSFRIRNDSNTGKAMGSDRDAYVEEHRRLVEKYGGELRLTVFWRRFSVWFRKFRNKMIGVYLKIFTK